MLELEDFISEKGKCNLSDVGRAISRITGKLVYIYDMYKRKTIYSSYSRSLFGGHDITFLKNHWHETFLTDTFEADRELIRCLFQSIPSVVENHSVTQPHSMVLHVCLRNRSKDNSRILTHHRITPIDLEKGIFIGVGEQVIDSGEWVAVLVIPEKEYYLRYNLESTEWEKCIGWTFSKNEKDMLRLSGQGLKIKEIATLLGKDENTVKAYRKRVLKGLGQKNITGAVNMAARYGII